jgi:hypothetical protein
MDLLDEFRRSETLTVSVSGDYVVVPALVRAGSFRVSDRRVPKSPGLSWVLSPGDVGLPDLPISLELRGRSAGVDASGRPLIRFTVDQEIGVRVPGRRVLVERARGGITVALSRAPGVPAVALTTVGDDNGFDVDIRANLLGFSRRATVHVTNLRIEATAWRPKSLNS